MDERNALVTDRALRDAQWKAHVDLLRVQEVLAFVNAYDHYYQLVEAQPTFAFQPAGAYFRIPIEINLMSAKAEILQSYYLMFRETPDFPPLPLLDVSDWGPTTQIFGYHPPYEKYLPETMVPLNQKRVRDM